MKRLIAVLAAAVVALAVYAVTAPAGRHQSMPSRVRALEQKVRQLQAFDKRVRQCLLSDAVPVTRYSDYLLKPQGDQPSATTTAIDVTHQGDKVGFLAVSLRPECAATFKREPATSRSAH